MTQPPRWKPLLTALIAGFALVFALFLPALAQPGADDAPPKGTPAAVPTDKPAPGDVGVQVVLAPNLTKSYYTARGAHAGETATYTLVVANTGNQAAAGVEATAPLPVNAAYVSGSAAVTGGGTLNVAAGVLTWQGTIGAAQSITITYQVVLPGTLGEAVFANATLYAPGIAAAVHLNTVLRIQAPTGGPDDFGYTVKDSTAPGGPSFSWVPTTTPASKLIFGPLPNDDKVTGTVPLGFTFQFYTGTYTEAYVSTNGLITFGAANADNTPDPVPAGDGANNLIACLWGDQFEASAVQGVWVETSGSPGSRRAVFTFQLVYFTANDAGVPPITFQAILSETSNTIKCQYLHTTGPNNGSGGQSAIEIEDAAGDAGLTYFYSSLSDLDPAIIGPVEDNLAVEFVPNGLARPIFTTSSLTASPNVHPGDTLTYTLIVSNSGNASAAGTTIANPIAPGTTYVPASAAVQGGGLLNALPSGITWTGTIGAGARVTITYQVLLPTTQGQVITSTATISAALAAKPVVLTNGRVRILPPTSGGPDSFNYSFKDRYAPSGPTFTWVPTTTPASKLNFGGLTVDDAVTTGVPLSFTFLFYGQPYTQVAISSNGQVLFGAPSNANNPDPIGTPGGQADNFAACFWSDLIIQDGLQGIWVETYGAPGSRTTVITFRESHFDSATQPPALFQMILAETSNTIKCQYAIVPPRDDLSGGHATTIGLENADGTSGVQYFYNPYEPSILGPIENGLAVLFTPGTLGPSFSASTKLVTPGMHPGNTVTYSVFLRNNSPIGAGAATLNDPLPGGTTYVPASANVVGGGVVNGGPTVTWAGGVAAGSTVTVSFSAVLPGLASPITNAATVNDPQASGPIVRTALTPMQPPQGLGVGPRFYRYRDSYSPGISSSWVPTTGASIKIALLSGNPDDGVGQADLAFPFTYFGHVFTRTLVTTNGQVLFNFSPNPDSLPVPVPTAGSNDNFAACLWLDQTIAATAQGMWAESFGSAPNRTTVITFYLTDIASGGEYTYQMILAETTNTLTCQYAGLPNSVPGATVGVEGPDGVTGVEYFHARITPPFIGPLEPGLAIRFEPAYVLSVPLVHR